MNSTLSAAPVHTLNRGLTPVKIAQIRLGDSPAWDKGRNVRRLKVTVESESGTVAEVTPDAGVTTTDQFTINYVVLDRNAFSDTFER